MKTVLFTTASGDQLHKVWKNFLLSPVDGYRYVDADGQTLTAKTWAVARGSTSLKARAIMKLYELKRTIPWLLFRYKLFEERQYSERVDLQTSDLIYCINGRLYHGDRPWVVDFENLSVFFGYNYRAMKLYKSAVKSILAKKNCKAIIAYSKTGKESFVKFFGRDLAYKVHVVQNNIAVPDVARKKHSGFNILFTGSANIGDNFYARGGKEVVHAFLALSKRHPDVRLVMRCSVPAQERALLEGTNAKIQEDLLTQEEFENLFATADVYLLPAYIGYALSTLEAMSYGLPLVTSDLLENGEAVENGVTGFKIKPAPLTYWMPLMPDYYFTLRFEQPLSQEYVGRIVEKLEYLYGHRAAARRIGAAAKRSVLRHHTIEQKNKVLKKIFDAS